ELQRPRHAVHQLLASGDAGADLAEGRPRADSGARPAGAADMGPAIRGDLAGSRRQHWIRAACVRRAVGVVAGLARAGGCGRARAVAAAVVPVSMQPMVPAVVPAVGAGAIGDSALAWPPGVGGWAVLLHGDAQLLGGSVFAAAAGLERRRRGVEHTDIRADLWAAAAGAAVGALGQPRAPAVSAAAAAPLAAARGGGGWRIAPGYFTCAFSCSRVSMTWCSTGGSSAPSTVTIGCARLGTVSSYTNWSGATGG